MAEPVKANSCDRTLVIITLVLLALGLVMVFSAGFVAAAESRGDPYFYLRRQTLWAAAGLPAMLALSRIHYRVWKRLSVLIIILNFVLLALVFSGFGTTLGTEARRWLALGPLTLQPSEFSKLALVIFTAAYMSSRRLNIRNVWSSLLVPLLVAAPTFFLIQGQPDLGTALVVFAGSALVVFFAGLPSSQLVGIGLLCLPPLAYFTLSEDYRMQRIFTLIDPWAEPTGAGYQIIQSLYALGPGHIFGVGLGRSRQKLFYLPEPQNDFIFAVIGEELGFIGALTVLLLYLFLIWRGFQIALRAPDLFGSLLASGITFILALQVLVNVGVVTATLPVTGITLPLISYGGSSLFFTLAGLGILLSISRQAVIKSGPERKDQS